MEYTSGNKSNRSESVEVKFCGIESKVSAISVVLSWNSLRYACDLSAQLARTAIESAIVPKGLISNQTGSMFWA